MTQSVWVTGIGSVCFGLVIGYITYRTLIRSDSSSISDLAAVIAAIGGGTITSLFEQGNSDSFGWYAIGLAVGFAVYGWLFRKVNGKSAFAQKMGDDALRPPGS